MLRSLQLEEVVIVRVKGLGERSMDPVGFWPGKLRRELSEEGKDKGLGIHSRGSYPALPTTSHVGLA